MTLLISDWTKSRMLLKMTYFYSDIDAFWSKKGSLIFILLIFLFIDRSIYVFNAKRSIIRSIDIFKKMIKIDKKINWLIDFC
jgi:hypothetical protein